MSQEKKGEVHPIVKEALDMAIVGVEPVELDEFAIEDLKKSLERWFGHPDLIKAVVDLINLAGILQNQGSPTAAMALMGVVATAAEPLQKITKNRKE